MALQAKQPSRLWLFVPIKDAERILALNEEYRDVRISAAEGEPMDALARPLGLSALLVGEKYGSYSGPIGGRPLLSRYTGKDEAAVREAFKKRHPRWSSQKLDRAVRDILENESYNALTDHLKRDYERMWTFVSNVVSLCGEGFLVYDNGRAPHLEEVVLTSSMLHERRRSAQRIKTKASNATVLYSIKPHEFYAFE